MKHRIHTRKKAGWQTSGPFFISDFAIPRSFLNCANNHRVSSPYEDFSYHAARVQQYCHMGWGNNFTNYGFSQYITAILLRPRYFGLKVTDLKLSTKIINVMTNTLNLALCRKWTKSVLYFTITISNFKIRRRSQYHFSINSSPEIDFSSKHISPYSQNSN